MQRQLPSLNAHAIDFREGRPAAGSASGWNADWSWQSKSKRDIIHDVFFFFQHRKVSAHDRWKTRSVNCFLICPVFQVS